MGYLRRIKDLFLPKRRLSKEESDYLFLKQCGVETEMGAVHLIGRPIISMAPGSRIVIENNVTLVSDPGWNEAGINHPVILSTSAPGAEIIIHQGVSISGASIVSCQKIEIGENTALGVNCNVWDTDFHFCDYDKRNRQRRIEEAPSAPIKLGERCWIAANVTILKGVEIGSNSVIGAMSLVTRSLPDNVVAGGNPARIIRQNQ